MAITVIRVGTVNCFFFAGTNDVEGQQNAIREAKEGGGVRKFQGERAGGEGSGRWTAGLNCQSRL